jgi:signal transduction histidine kinase
VQFLRAWSRRAPLPVYWGYRSALADTSYFARLPIRRLHPVKRFSLLNEADADSALLMGDAARAMTRARELLAGSRHLIDQPLYIDMMVGRYMLQRGARLLVRAAQQGDEPMLAGAAKRLDAMVESNYALSREERRFLQDLADTPEDGRLLEFVADRSLPAAIRAETPLTTMVTAACRSPREMMFGLSSARRAAFEEMMTAISDIPRMAEMTPFMRRALETFESPERFLAGLNAPRSNDVAHTVPLLLVPSSLRARVEFCRDQGL